MLVGKLLILIFIAATTRAQDYQLLFKFLKHRSTVFDLNLLLKSVENGVEDADNFLSAYNDQYRNTTEWLLTAVTKKDNNDLLTTVKLQTEFHFRKIKQFYDQLIETFNMASNIEVAEAKLLKKDPFSLKTKHGLWRGQILQKIDTAEQSLVTSEWRPAAEATVLSVLEDSNSAHRVAKGLLEILKDKFPFRVWLVFSSASGTDFAVCFPENLRLLPPQSLGRSTVHVLQSEPLREDLSMTLGRIVESKVVNPFYCGHQSSAILAEMTDSCEDFRRTGEAIGVFAEGSPHELHSSDGVRLQQKTVIRHFWKFCRQQYTAFSFH